MMRVVLQQLKMHFLLFKEIIQIINIHLLMQITNMILFKYGYVGKFNTYKAKYFSGGTAIDSSTWYNIYWTN